MADTFDFERMYTKYFDPKGGLTDQYFSSTPLLDRFWSKRKKKSFVSRQPIYMGLEIGEQAPETYQELETFDRTRAQITKDAYATPANYHTQLVISWDDEKRNGSAQDMANLVKSRSANILKSWAKGITTALISGDGTSDAMLGFSNMFSETGIGTVQNINAASSDPDYTWWANKYINGADASIDLASLHKVCIEAADGQDKPTLLAMDKYLESYILTSLFQARERYQDGRTKHMAKLPLIYDIPSMTDPALETSGATSGNIWALNENYLYIVVHPKDDMHRHGTVRPADQLAYVTDWTAEFQLVLTQRRKQCLGHSFAV